MYRRVFGAQNGRAPSIFSIRRRPWVLQRPRDDVGGREEGGGGALRCFCPRAQETLVTPLILHSSVAYPVKDTSVMG